MMSLKAKKITVYPNFTQLKLQNRSTDFYLYTSPARQRFRISTLKYAPQWVPIACQRLSYQGESDNLTCNADGGSLPLASPCHLQISFPRCLAPQFRFPPTEPTQQERYYRLQKVSLRPMCHRLGQSPNLLGPNCSEIYPGRGRNEEMHLGR